MLLVSSPLRAPGIAKARQNSRRALATKKVIRECAFFFPSFFLAGQLAEGWLKADQSCVPAYTQRTDDGARAVFLLCFHCPTEAGRLPIRSKAEVMEKQSCGLDQAGAGDGVRSVSGSKESFQLVWRPAVSVTVSMAMTARYAG